MNWVWNLDHDQISVGCGISIGSGLLYTSWNLGGLWTMDLTFGVGLRLSGFSRNLNSLSGSLFSPVFHSLCLGIAVIVRVKWTGCECWNVSSMVYACVGCYLLVWCSSWRRGSGLVLWQRLLMVVYYDMGFE